MISEALGRLNNTVYPGNDTYVSLKDAAGVTFYLFEASAASTVTVTFSSDAAGSATSTPAVIDHYYGLKKATSGGVWHRTAVSPAASVFTKSSSTEDFVAVEILATSCPDGKPYVKCTSGGSGIVFPMLHDLAYQKAPANLRSITA